MKSVSPNEQKDFVLNSKLDKDKMSTQTNYSSNQNTRQLKAAKRKYKYNYTYIPSIAMVDKLPCKEYPSLDWLGLLLKQFIKILFNALVVFFTKWETSDRDSHASHGSLNSSEDVDADNESQISSFFNRLLIPFILLCLLRTLGAANLSKFPKLMLWLMFVRTPKRHVKSLQEYNNFFKKVELPNVANNFQEDKVFAYMRVAGYNPLTIERVSKLQDNFPLTEALYQEVMGSDDSLITAGEEGRLYIADYKALAGAANGTYPKEQKYIYAPIALFAVPKDSDSSRLMRPVAIQCSQNPDDTPIVTPKSSKYAWLFAKTVVQIADANFHEALSHLGRTHLFVGRFAIVTHRQFPNSHAVRFLLRPHV